MKLTLSNARIMLDRLRPDRPVRRRIRGIEMVLPRRHILPYMATQGSPYAQNLVDLAVLLGHGAADLVVLDIGANIGDSALLILNEIDCRIVCVEGDSNWLTYLEQNVGNLPNVAIEPSLVSADRDQFVNIVHADVGTSHVVTAGPSGGVAALPVDELIARHPELHNVRLVKTDTDGFDVRLAVASAQAFSSSRPVIFFEYDPRATRLLSPESDPSAVWEQLAERGYEHSVVWTNGGHLLGSGPVRDLTARSEVLESECVRLEYGFWDVAVAHADDAEGRAVLETMVRQAKWRFPGRWA